MKALSDPIVIGLTAFAAVMINGYFSAKWQAKYEHEHEKQQ